MYGSEKGPCSSSSSVHGQCPVILVNEGRGDAMSNFSYFTASCFLIIFQLTEMTAVHPGARDTDSIGSYTGLKSKLGHSLAAQLLMNFLEPQFPPV